MRWTWNYLNNVRVLHDDNHHTVIPGAGCVEIQVTREQDTGMPPNFNELEDRVQQTSGKVWLFNYIDARTITLRLQLFGKHAYDIGAKNIVTAKRILAQWFNPQPTAPDGILTFYDDEGIVRAINARYDRGLDYDWVYLDQGTLEADLRLLCPDPLWYDPELQEVTWSSSGDNLVLCYTLPYSLCVGVGATQTVVNAGDWATYPIIIIDGPAFDVTIQNTTTGESIGATYSLAAGKSATYNLAPGVKTIFDSDGNNLMSTLIQPNDLATFHLACAYEYNESGVQIAPNGNNVITITSGASSTVARMTWYNRYLTN